MTDHEGLSVRQAVGGAATGSPPGRHPDYACSPTRCGRRPRPHWDRADRYGLIRLVGWQSTTGDRAVAGPSGPAGRAVLAPQHPLPPSWRAANRRQQGRRVAGMVLRTPGCKRPGSSIT